MKTQIQYKKNKVKYGFIGMNKFAAEAHHIKWAHKKHPEKTIEVYSKVPKNVRLNTIHHEEMENYLMKNKHMNYPRAHHVALRFEKLNKPFPSKNTKQGLHEMGFKINVRRHIRKIKKGFAPVRNHTRRRR